MHFLRLFNWVKQPPSDDQSLIQLDILQWVNINKYESSHSFVLVAGQTSTPDQDLRTCTIAMFCAIYEFKWPYPMQTVGRYIEEISKR